MPARTKAGVLLLAAGAAVMATTPLHAATIQVINADGAGEGFNDPTPVAPVFGNPATTRGQQRMQALTAAAAYWANRLSSPVAITVRASMDALTCSSTSGVLGGASAVSGYANFPGAPAGNTWFAVALANALRGADNDPLDADIQMVFNSRLDDNDPGCLPGLDWFYGIGTPAPAGTRAFVATVQHELGHGLGMATFTNGATGSLAQGRPTVYDTFLEDHSTGLRWHQMTNGQRQASATDTGDLHWAGSNVVAASAALAAGRHPSGHVQMYSPNPFEQGSSVSHWSTALTPDEMMEPFATASASDIVTTAALRDMGWTLLQTGACVPDADTACLGGGRFDVSVTYQTASQSGNAQVMSFGGQRAENSESVFFTFFSGTNFEMGLKILNACGINGKFWVFVSGLTDQGWTVTIRDTQTGAVRTYGNAVGQLSSTFADTTQALSCQ